MRLTVLALAAALTGLSAPLFAQQAAVFTRAEIDAAPACNEGRGIEEGIVQLCTCKATTFKRFVWGSGPYSGHSDVCTAARHAGVVDEAGGSVTAIRVKGPDAYAGSSANGVTSSKWGSFEQSITFDRN